MSIVSIQDVVVERKHVTLKCSNSFRLQSFELKYKPDPPDWPYNWAQAGIVPYYIWEAVHVFSGFKNGQWVCGDCGEGGD